MKTIDPGYLYELDNGQQIQFRKASAGIDGATTEEVIGVLIARQEALRDAGACYEDFQVLKALSEARVRLMNRRDRRERAGVLGTGEPHDK